MSYRTSVNNFQIFGNNEYYPEWIEFIKSQGIKVNEDGDYDGEIKDVMKAIETIENIVLRLEKELREEVIDKHDDRYGSHYLVTCDSSAKKKHYKSLFDFSNIYDKTIEYQNKPYGVSLVDQLLNIQQNAYAFMPLTFIDACKDCITSKLSKDRHRTWEYHLIEGKTINVHAG